LGKAYCKIENKEKRLEYFGEMKDGKASGSGLLKASIIDRKAKNHDEYFYFGDYKEGKKHGKGLEIFPN